jgi:hypothetical protein
MKHLYAIAATVLLALCVIACGKSIETYGETPDEKAAKTPISAILFSPKQYLDKEVVIEGTISSECPTGGWINVQDASGHTIYVEFHGAEFAPIPQRAGSPVVVKGVVFQSEAERKEVQLLGKGVVIR